jgi:hypothetical protein
MEDATMKTIIKPLKTIFIIIWIITLTFGGVSVSVHAGNAPCSVIIDGQPVRFQHPVYTENQDAYIAVDDVFSYYGFDRQTDFKAGVSAYISSDMFFTVDHKTLALKINGLQSAVSLKSLDQQWFINAKDLIHIIPVTSAYNQSAGELRLTTGWNSDLVVHLDNIKAFAPKGSFKIKNNQVWIGIYTLPNILLESDVYVNSGNLEINSPTDGSHTKIYFNGRVEYRPAGAAQPIAAAFDRAAMLSGSGDDIRLNADLISKYSSYTVTVAYSPSAAKAKFDIRIQSPWNNSGQAGGPETIVISDAAVPLGSIVSDGAVGSEPPVTYEPPAADTHPSARDSGYVLNKALMDDVAAEINRYRANAGLSPLPVNHSLVYKKQNSTPGRTTAFDNLRWCREHLSGRTLEHLTPAPYMSEILMTEFNTGLSPAMIVNLWISSPVHNAIIMNPGQKEFGICAIQYPNGDIDVSGVFSAQ